MQVYDLLVHLISYDSSLHNLCMLSFHVLRGPPRLPEAGRHRLAAAFFGLGGPGARARGQGWEGSGAGPRSRQQGSGGPRAGEGPGPGGPRASSCSGPRATAGAGAGPAKLAGGAAAAAHVEWAVLPGGQRAPTPRRRLASLTDDFRTRTDHAKIL